jgi:hypothetical protein
MLLLAELREQLALLHEIDPGESLPESTAREELRSDAPSDVALFTPRNSAISGTSGASGGKPHDLSDLARSGSKRKDAAGSPFANATVTAPGDRAGGTPYGEVNQ